MNLIFDKYYVPELIFKEKKVTDKKVEFTQQISSNIKIKHKIVSLTLDYSINENEYIDVKVAIVGTFKLELKDKEALDSKDKITSIKATALAILFPYLRQTVTSLTQLNGSLNPIIIPTYNIAKLLEDKSE